MSTQCFINREIVPEFDHEFRWILDSENPCNCSSVSIGSVHREPPKRSFQPMMITCPDELIDKDEETLKKLLSCSILSGIYKNIL